jgi:hypothetical protein
MAKRGRKRKALVQRQPNGQPSRAKAHNVKIHEYSPSEIARFRRKLVRDLNNPLIGTYLGELNLQGIVSDVQVSAAMKYERIDDAWRKANNRPRETARAQDVGAVRGLGMDVPDDMVVEITRLKESSRAALLACGGAIAVRVVNTVCLRNEYVDYSDRLILLKALTKLADHYGLTSRKIDSSYADAA